MRLESCFVANINDAAQREYLSKANGVLDPWSGRFVGLHGALKGLTKFELLVAFLAALND